MSVSRKVQMGAGGSGGDPWSFEKASYNVGTGNNNQLGGQELTFLTGNTNGLVTYPVGIDFKTDGTMAFVLTLDTGNEDVIINSYALSSAFDLTTATHTGYKQLKDESETLRCFKFSGDGTKIYYADRTNLGGNVIRQYSLSTAWDISNVSPALGYAATLVNFDGGFVFNNTGTVLYLVPDSADDTIVPFTLGTAWDLSGTVTQGTAITFTDASFLTNGGWLVSMDFSHDGTVLYTLSSASDSVSAVEVTTPYDLSSIDDTNQSSRDANSFRVGLPPGSAKVISDSSSVRVFGAWDSDVGALRYNYNRHGITCSLANEGPNAATNPNAFEWEYRSSVFAPQYDSGGALNSLIYGSPSGGSTKNYITSFWFNSDGTKLYTVYSYNNYDEAQVGENTLSIPYDVGSVSALGTSAVYGTGVDMFQIFFIDDGNKFCRFRGTESGTIEVWTTSIPYVLVGATRTLFGEYAFSNQVTSSPVIRRIFSSVYGIAFNDDGTKMYLSYGTTSSSINNRTLSNPLSSQVIEISLSSAWNPSTADFSEMPWIVHDQGTNDSDFIDSVGFEFKSDGSEFFTMGNEQNYWWKHVPIVSNKLVSVGNPVRASTFLSQNTGLLASTVSSWQFKADGTRWFGYDNGNLKQIYQKDLATAWDAPSSLGNTANPTFASYPSNAVRRISTPIQNVTFNPTGTKYYQLSTTGMYEYPLSTAWDLSTASISSTHTMFMSSSGGYTSSDFGDIVWGDNGFKLYQLGRYNTTLASPFITEWTASVAYDLSSLGNTPYTASITPNAGSFPQSAGMRFKPDGTKLFISLYIATSTYVVEYTLSSAWNLSTINGTSPHAPATSTYLSVYYGYQAVAIEFNSTGSIMYLAQRGGISYFNLSIPWDTTSSSSNQADQLIRTYGWPSNAGDNSTIFITSDGTKYFRGSGEADFVGHTLRMNFGTAYDWSTISVAPSDKSFNFFKLIQFPNTGGNDGRAVGVNVTEFRFSSDGTKLYTAEAFENSSNYNNPNGNNNGGFCQHNLSTPWDVTTASYIAFKEILTSGGGISNTNPITSFDISSDGSWIILSSVNSNNDFYIGTMSTPYDITTLGTLTSFADANGGTTTATSKGLMSSTGACAIRFNSDGTALYVRGDYFTDECSFVKVDLPSAYTLGPLDIKFPSGIGDGGPLSNIGVASDGGSYLLSPVFGNNGYKFYVSAAKSTYSSVTLDSRGTDQFCVVNEYTLTSPYDLSTATFTTALDLVDPTKNWTQGVLDTGSLYLHWSSDGRKFYLAQGTQIGEYKV
tara:strand:- start:945 stop:4769 length:3825 start_codon:yes stop_codon:yes gene_type:complete